MRINDLMFMFLCRTITIIDAQLQTEITKMIREEFGDRDLTRQVGWVRDCLQKRDLMTVFRLEGKNSAKDIDIAILQALLKGIAFIVSEWYRLAKNEITLFCSFNNFFLITGEKNKLTSIKHY